MENSWLSHEELVIGGPAKHWPAGPDWCDTDTARAEPRRSEAERGITLRLDDGQMPKRGIHSSNTRPLDANPLQDLFRGSSDTIELSISAVVFQTRWRLTRFDRCSNQVAAVPNPLEPTSALALPFFYISTSMS